MSRSPYDSAGMGFPNGEVDFSRIFALPSPDLLMLATEARWHHDTAAQAGKQVLWRAIPRQGARPAEMGWNAGRFVHEALYETERAMQPISGFIWANELDLQDERGDSQNDFMDLAKRYSTIGKFSRDLLYILRAMPSAVATRLHFPAFTPDHGALEYREFWDTSADLYDVIDFHAYNDLDTIQAAYQAYREAFPQKMLALTEWHCRGDVEEEERVLNWLSEAMASDPDFDAAYRFIWRWDDAPGWWDSSFNVEGNPAMENLFLNPPIAMLPVPTPEPTPPPEPQPEEPPVTTPTYPTGIDVSNNNGMIDWDQVAATGMKFAFSKADQGDYFTDGYLGTNWAESKRVGLYRGAYHFADPDRVSAVKSAEHFMAVMATVGIEPGDMLALDLEWGTGNLADWTFQWMQRVEQLAGFAPLIYTSPAFVYDHGLSARPELAAYGLWLASWGVPTPPPAPYPWTLVAFHQYRVGPAGTVPGIAGDIDLNRFNGTDDRIPYYGKPLPSEPLPGPAPTYSVGEGLLQKMTAVGDTPNSDERFFPLWSEALGQSGTRYIYWKNTGEISMEAPKI